MAPSRNGFTIEILDFAEVHSLPGTWDAEQYRRLLSLFDFEEISEIADAELADMAAMAAQDKGVRPAADQVLYLVFGDTMSSGVRQNLIDDLTGERPWEQCADLDRQAGVFETVDFLQRAFPTEFGVPDAARVRVSLTACGKNETEWLREGPKPSLLMRLLADMMDDRAVLRRLYQDQLGSNHFPEADAIVWSISKTADQLDEDPAVCVLDVHSSLQWLSPLRAVEGKHASDAEPDAESHAEPDAKSDGKPGA